MVGAVHLVQGSEHIVNVMEENLTDTAAVRDALMALLPCSLVVLGEGNEVIYEYIHHSHRLAGGQETWVPFCGHSGGADLRPSYLLPKHLVCLIKRLRRSLWGASCY